MIKYDPDTNMCSITTRMAVTFAKKQDEWIMQEIVKHISQNGEEYEIYNIPPEKLKRILLAGIKAIGGEEHD